MEKILDLKIEEYRTKTKKYEDEMLEDVANKEAFINYYISVNTLEKLLDLKMMMC